MENIVEDLSMMQMENIVKDLSMMQMEYIVEDLSMMQISLCIITDETFLKKILNRTIQNIWKIVKKCFIDFFYG